MLSKYSLAVISLLSLNYLHGLPYLYGRKNNSDTVITEDEVKTVEDEVGSDELEKPQIDTDPV